MSETPRPIVCLVLVLVLILGEMCMTGVYVTGRMLGIDHSIITFWLNVNMEWNLPTWFSTQLLFCVGLCWGLVAWLNLSRPGRSIGYAVAMAAMFLFFSFDEMVGIHERIGGAIDGESRKGTAFHYTGRWPFLLVPITAAGLGVVLWRVHAAHGWAITRPLIYGGALFLIMAGFGDLLENVWDGPVSHVWQVAFEEMGEMAGVTIMLGASLHAVANGFRERVLGGARKEASLSEYAAV